MQEGVVLIGPELPYLSALSASLRSLSRNVTIRGSRRPLATALAGLQGQPHAAIICLTGVENVADVRLVMTSHPETKFLFLSRAAPPRASMAHAIHKCGGQVLPLSEPAIVIAATLITMLASETAEQSR